MIEVIWATPLYEFLRQCNANSLSKKVLDCGAGGDHPPLSLFYQYRYKTYGIEIEDQQLSKAKMFCKTNQMPLNIFHGDMHRIPFRDEAFSFVYSFNAIFFMTKPDISIAMSEIERVLKLRGLCYVNFTSVKDPDNCPFCETMPVRHLLKSEQFAKHKDYESGIYCEHFDIIRKEKRLIDKVHGSGRSIQAYV